MLANFLVVVGQVVTLFLFMGVGFLLAQLGKLRADGVSQMAYLVLYIIAPCVMIRSFETPRTPELTLQILQFALIFSGTYLLFILISRFCFRRETPMRQGPMRFGIVYGNNGFMGLPLLLAILGERGMMFGVVSVVLFNLFEWTHGVMSMGGKITPRQALVNPGTIGLAVGLMLFLPGWRLPTMVDAAVSGIADLNTPLAMMVVGAQMAGADLKLSFTSLKLYLSAGYKLLLAPLLPLLLLLPFHLDPTLYCAVVILCAVPTAGVTAMLAQRFEKDVVVSAQMVTLSTLLSIFTLPVVAVAAQTLSGL